MNLALFSFSFSGNSPFFPRKTSILLCGYCPQTSFATETLELGNIMWVLQVRQTSFLANKHLHFMMKSHRALYLHKVLLNNFINDDIEHPAYATCNFVGRVFFKDLHSTIQTLTTQVHFYKNSREWSEAVLQYRKQKWSS